MATFGVPCEVRDLEKRVGLTPPGVFTLVQKGHTIYVQKDAGQGAGFRNEDYRQGRERKQYTRPKKCMAGPTL